MWCLHCGQDVPGVASGNGTALSCVRCGGSLARHFTSPSALDESGRSESTDSSQPREREAIAAEAIAAEVDDWALDLEMQRMRRLIQAAARDPIATQPQNTLNAFASLDAAHQHLQQAYFRTSSHPVLHATATPTGKRPPQSRLSAATWSMLALGLMASVCGGVLLAWSLLAGRAALWTCGMPIALGGQLALLVGLVLRMDLLGDANRRTVDQLETVDKELDDLKRDAAVASATQNGPSQAFYAHLTRGANPQLMLADLKGQLDLLAVQMASPQR
jgi:hypothetical protein